MDLILQRVFTDLLGESSPTLVDALSRKVEPVHLKKGDVLYRQGEPGTGMHVLVAGRLQVRVAEEVGGPERVVAQLSPGEVAGEIALFTVHGRAAKSEIPNLLNSADIFINTTNVDNTPVSVLEAMACGLCVVSTDVGGLSFLLEHEKDALLVPPDDAEAMAAAIVRILGDKDLAESLSRNGRAKTEHFDWQNIVPK